ncbi:MAG TPA: translation elongation factor Ts [Bryobacteraceae bacterium]|jgi:elongation factor Ts|nr:translation elongation factor Ts [Bryobacteraceae bacterium]
MAEISAQLVKQLREKTGAGMMECKKALVETNGDIAEAEVVLRKRGITAAGKKETRSTKQGLIGAHISSDHKTGVLVEVNCESDFVARTEDFQTLTADVAAHIAETKPKAVRLEEVTEAERANIKQHEALYEQKFTRDQSTTVAELVKSKIAKLGENINISRFAIQEVNGHGTVGHYIHTGGQIGVLLEVNAGKAETSDKEEFRTLVRDLAMQVAAASPQFVSKENVDPGVLNKEREIQKERARGEGKPDKMLDKIVEGRLAKFYEEICLLEQPFIRENSLTITDLIKNTGAKLGDSHISVARFVRFKVGDAGDAPGVHESPLPVTA